MRFRKASALVLAFFLVVSFFVVFPFGVFPVPLGHADSLHWVNSSLAYRQSEVVNSASGANVSYQVQLTILNSSGSSSGNVMKENNHTRSDFGDIKFYSNDNSTGLNYWQQNVTSGQNSTFWVQMPSSPTYGNLSSSNQTLWVYYGNSTVTTSSSGVNTFLFFDNFANTSKWISKVGSWSANSNVMNQTSTTSIGWLQQTAHWGIMTSSYTLPNTYALGVQMEVNNGGGVNYIGFGEHANATTPGMQGELRQYTTSSYIETEHSNDYNGSSSVTSSVNTWYSAELRKQNSSYETLVIAGLFTTYLNSSYYPSNGYITMDMYDGKCGFQNMYVRNYVNPEPGNGAWTAEETYSVADTTPPTYSALTTNSTVWATACNFSIICNDNSALSPNGQYIFGCNNTGPFTNETAGNFTTMPQGESFVKTLNSTNSNATTPETVQYEWWITDNAGNKNNTGLKTLTLSWALSVGWNNVTIFSFDVGFTLGGVNASLNYDSISWSYIVYQNSSTSAQYPFANGMSYNNLVTVYQTTGILLIFCSAAGNWTHTYPLQGGNYGSDPTPIIIAVTLVGVGVALLAYGISKAKRKQLSNNASS